MGYKGLRDAQDRRPRYWCAGCGSEIYSEEDAAWTDGLPFCRLCAGQREQSTREAVRDLHRRAALARLQKKADVAQHRQRLRRYVCGCCGRNQSAESSGETSSTASVRLK